MEKWQRSLYQPNLPLGADGTKVTASKAHITLSKEAAKEGMVLLKNNESLLPFQAGTKLALFGKGSFDYVKGGGGSGDVTVAYTTNLYEGFKKLPEKVEVYEALYDYYRKEVEKQYEAGAEPGMTVEPAFPEETAKKARAYTDTAVICISRFSGEGWDRKSSYDKEMDESVQTDPLLEKAERIFPDGDFYLDSLPVSLQMCRKVFRDEGRERDGGTGAAVVPEGGSRYECRRHGRYGLVCRK